MNARRTAAFVLSGLACAGVGFLGGASVQEPRVANAPLASQVVEAPTQREVESPCGHDHAVQEAEHDHGHAHHAHAEPGQADAEAAPFDLGPALDAARAVGEAPTDEHVQEAALLAADDVYSRLINDPAALASALSEFRQRRDPHELSFLASVLGRVRDPEVEALALELAASSSDPAQRAAAFDVLDAFDTPFARDVALATLERDPGVDLRRAALRALPDPVGISAREASAVRDTLRVILVHDTDVELRRRSAIAFAAHASASQLDPVFTTLTRDPDPGVRAGAAFALETAGHRDPVTLAALTGALNNTDEDPLVRDNAWHALGALAPLPHDAHQAYTAYALEREALNEDVE